MDVTGTPEQMGKATKKDAGKGKNTYPACSDLKQASAKPRSNLKAALDSLDPLGEAALGLKTLARFVVERTS